MDNNSPHEIIARAKKFYENSLSFFADFRKNIEDDRQFVSGEQFSATDSANRGKGRIQQVYNFISRFIVSITNPLAKNGFSIEAEAKDENTSTESLNATLKDVLRESNFKKRIEEALKESLEVGISHLVLSTVEKNGIPSPFISKVHDPLNVLLDPDALESDFSDANSCMVIDFVQKPQDYVKSFLPTKGELVAKASFFERNQETGTVTLHQIIGESVKSFELPLQNIPVFSLVSETTFKNEKKIPLSLTAKLKGPQKTINFTLSALQERLLYPTKNAFLVEAEAIAGHEEYFANVHKNLSPVLPYNGEAASGRALNVPQKLDLTVQTADLHAILSSELQFMSDLAGIPVSGITGNTNFQETAEAVLLKSRSTENNIANFYTSTHTLVQNLGETLLELLSSIAGFDANSYRIVTVNGMESITQKETDRKVILALMQVVPEGSPERQKLLEKLFKTLDMDLNENNEGQEDPEALQVMNEMKAGAEQLQKQNEELQNYIAQLQNAVYTLQEGNETKLLIAQMDAQTKLQLEAMKQEGRSEELTQKILLENARLIEEREHKLAKIQLEAEKVANENPFLRPKNFGVARIS